MENGAFYITRREVLERYCCRLGGKIGIYEMPPNTAIEIDEPEDWGRVECMLESKKYHLVEIKKLMKPYHMCEDI